MPRDTTDFETFVEAHERSLRRTAFLLCGDWARAEDATQDGLVKLYRAWPRLDRGPALRSYAHRIVTNAVLDQGRRPWRRERSGLLPDVAADAPDSDRRIAVLAALRSLPAQRRACVVLRYFADLSVEETAMVLGVTSGTVKSTTARALDQLRDALGAAGLDLLLED